MSGQADIAGTAHKWAEVGRGARTALELLGYPPMPACMPDEAEACGVGVAEHVAAYLATIKAVCDHQLNHLGQPYIMMHGVVYVDKREELEADPNCQGVHR